MLRAAGFKVIPCSCADEAIATLQSGVEDVSLLITDILLPGTNGRDLAKAVQAQVPGVHVIYMSGFSAGHLTESALNEPNTVFLQKPFNRARLYAAINELSSNATM
jgi:DNA-binding NtrC family response regulator